MKCRKEYARKWEIDNAEHRKEYRALHREEKQAYSKEYRKKNRDKLRKYRLEWRKRNKDKCRKYGKTLASLAYREKYYEQNKNGNIKINNRLSKYGLNTVSYEKIFNSQNEKCAICGESLEFLGRYTCVDHNHITGEVRGLLCCNCNWGVGHFKDSTPILLKAIEYLNKPKLDF